MTKYTIQFIGSSPDTSVPNETYSSVVMRDEGMALVKKGSTDWLLIPWHRVHLVAVEEVKDED